MVLWPGPLEDLVIMAVDNEGPTSQLTLRWIRWNDPYFKMSWPIPFIEVSPNDKNWPDFGGYFAGLEMLRGLK